jgi:hypothetical protein
MSADAAPTVVTFGATTRRAASEDEIVTVTPPAGAAFPKEKKPCRESPAASVGVNDNELVGCVIVMSAG